MGSTLSRGVAVEIPKTYSPWEGGQIVVALSRAMSPDLTVIVGDADGTFAINEMWELITMGNQWTQYGKNILDTISIKGDNIEPRERTFDYPEVSPF